MEYSKTELKAGLEIHQQLDTHKLFCNCPSLLRNDESLFKIQRKLNPVTGETGKIDSAAKHEKIKNKKFIYEVYDTNCLVELDEEPPHEINQEALKIAIQIGCLLNCKFFPTTQIMRKTVIDGSNTSGFQRTVLIGHDGFIETSNGKVGIETIALEEDSARIISSDEKISTFRLDRLGIPLIEITTKPDLKTPEQIKETALKIGEILRACNVKRGIGTIRQDLNISIKSTERTEIKGFQDPKTMIKTVNTEIQRQTNLIYIHEELKKRGANKIEIENLKDLTETLKHTTCKFIKESIEKNSKVIGINLPGFSQLMGKELCENKRFGTELSDYAKIHGVGGLIHSDENLKKYTFTNEEINKIKEVLNIKKNDAFILIVGEKEKIKKALESAIQRANSQIENTSVKEVRKANPDGTTSFLRPMPGEARMYPETDTKLLKINKEILNEISSDLPKLASENKGYLEEFGLNDELIKNILKNNKLNEFKQLLEKTKNAQLVAKCLTIFPKEIASKKQDSIENVEYKLNIEILEKILTELEKGNISENDFKIILQKIYEGENIENAIKKEKINLEDEIKKLIKEKPSLSENAYMGLIMNKFKGIVNGKEVLEEIKRIRDILGE